MSKNYKTHSAYKSMAIAKENKNKTKGGLKRWIDEQWQNLTPKIFDDNKFYECGKKSKEQISKNIPSVCRPSKAINNKTPKPLSKDITKKQIKKAVEIKKKGKYIKWNQL